MLLNACKGVIKVIAIDAQTFLDKQASSMLGVIWQLVRVLTIAKVQKSINRSSTLRASTQIGGGNTPVIIPSKVAKKLQEPGPEEIDDPFKLIQQEEKK